jgi:hypothetical protein
MQPGAWPCHVDLDSFDALPDEGGSTVPQRDDVPPRMAASDRIPNDLAGIEDPDNVHSIGDETLIFQDGAAQSDGTPRPGVFGTPPLLGQGYWYTVQPVLSTRGIGPTATAFNGIGFAGEIVFADNHAMNVGGVQGIDLDGSPSSTSPGHGLSLAPRQAAEHRQEVSIERHAQAGHRAERAQRPWTSVSAAGGVGATHAA